MFSSDVYIWVVLVRAVCLRLVYMGFGGISLDVCLCGWVVLVGAVFFRYISFLKSPRCHWASQTFKSLMFCIIQAISLHFNP